MTDLTFLERAIQSFIVSANNGIVSPKDVKRILKYKSKNINIEQIEVFLTHENPWVRKMTVQVVCQLGNIKKVIELAKKEEDKNVLLEIIDQLSKRKKSEIEELIFLLDSEDKTTKKLVIDMFRRVGRVDCLINLLFDSDDALVDKVKQWMENIN